MMGYLLAEQNGRPEFSIFLKESGDVVYGNGDFPGKERYSLSKFLRSAAGVAQGQKVSRRDVIKYIANVKSGVHSSGSQRQSEKTLISRMKKFEKKVIMNTPNDSREIVRKASIDALFIELLAIAQAIGASDDASTFIRKVYW